MKANLPGAQDIDYVEPDGVVLGASLLFPSGSAKLTDEGMTALDGVVPRLEDAIASIPKGVPWALQIDGHSDDLPVVGGRYRSNWELSAARASSVAQYLAERGIPRQHLIVAGLADTEPLARDHSDEARQINRRIEIRLTGR